MPRTGSTGWRTTVSRLTTCSTRAGKALPFSTRPLRFSVPQNRRTVMPTSLVTGGAGFIGSHLVEALVATGHQVRVLDDLSTGKGANLRGVRDRVEVVTGSLTDAGTVCAAVKDSAWVFHLGALPSVQRSVEDPVSTHEVCA